MGKAAIGRYASERNADRVHRGIGDGMFSRGDLWQHGKSHSAQISGIA